MSQKGYQRYINYTDKFKIDGKGGNYQGAVIKKAGSLFRSGFCREVVYRLMMMFTMTTTIPGFLYLMKLVVQCGKFITNLFVVTRLNRFYERCRAGL